MWAPLSLFLLFSLEATAFTPSAIQISRRVSPLAMADDSDDKSDVYVMVNGMPGPMATAAAEACLRKGLKLAPVAMTGPEMEKTKNKAIEMIKQEAVGQINLHNFAKQASEN